MNVGSVTEVSIRVVSFCKVDSKTGEILLVNNEEVVEIVFSVIGGSLVIAVVISELFSSTYSTKDLSFIVEVSDKIGFSTNSVLLFDIEVISLFEFAIICEDIVVETSEDRNEEIGTEVCDENIGFKVLEVVDSVVSNRNSLFSSVEGLVLCNVGVAKL
jgi:hypothetical protein